MNPQRADAKHSIWRKAIQDCSDPQRAKQYLRLLEETIAGKELEIVSSEEARILSAVFAGSQVLSGLLVAHPEWLSILRPDALQFGRRKQGLRQELDGWLEPFVKTGDFGGGLARVREFKAREMLRIGARDLARLGKVSDIIRELSDVADVCLESVWQACLRQLFERYGHPYHKDTDGQWHRTPACVLGMGKLGGQELNYSSDVDVLFVYAEEGEVYKTAPNLYLDNGDGADEGDGGATGTNRAVAGRTTERRPRGRGRPRPVEEAPRPVLTNHQFFNRLAEAFIAEVTRLGPEGALYRIDLRLRPEGNSGPLTRSVGAYENYYAQWGQTWERMMLIKARVVAGDQSLAAEFLETIQPFRYPRSINHSVLIEVGTMKDRIENEVVKPQELERNVKLGRGGIREIEFVAQSLQLLHAGRQPFLQSPQTLPSLEKLTQYELLAAEASRSLREAYCFLRDVEHRLQMENDQQTHTIPADPHAQQRLARLMGFASQKEFQTARHAHSKCVRGIFDSLLKGEVSPTGKISTFPQQFEGAEQEWRRLLAEHGFKDLDRALRVLREFVQGPGYVHVSPRTTELAYGLLQRIFALCPPAKKPEGRRPKAERNPKAEGRINRPTVQYSSDFGFRPSFGLRVSGFGFPQQSSAEGRAKPRLSDPDRVVTRLDSFISAYGARATLFELWNSNPAIFELLLLLFDRSEFLAELAIRTPDLVDELVTSGRLRQRKSAEETLRDLRHGLGDADQRLWLRKYHQTEVMRIGLRDILGLADNEQYLTELSALADACLRYALEAVMHKHGVKAAPFVIIGLGKLGGAEIDYGSDLDILFVAGARAKNLGKLKSLALEIMDLLSSRTEQGLVFHSDARLRPDGEKGLLVNTITAYEDYYRRRAMLWEIQTLTRSRPISGDLDLGEKFQKMAADLTNFKHPSQPLAAYTPDWKSRIHQMRMRIELERTPRGQGELAIKTGAGGLMDAEFIAQTLCLEHGWLEANTLRALERGLEAGVLPEPEKLIANYRQVRRVEGILRRWSYEGETVLPQDPAPYYRVAVRCGFTSAEEFREALSSYRQVVREVYEKVFSR
jgi:glutamate-ammonia-ligase adenylyltransferase